MVNNDPKSKQYGKWQSFILSSKNRVQILVPPRFGNGHLVLSKKQFFIINKIHNMIGVLSLLLNGMIQSSSLNGKKTPILSIRDK